MIKSKERRNVKTVRRKDLQALRSGCLLKGIRHREQPHFETLNIPICIWRPFPTGESMLVSVFLSGLHGRPGSTWGATTNAGIAIGLSAHGTEPTSRPKFEAKGLGNIGADFDHNP
jgi:hypothetical protein